MDDEQILLLVLADGNLPTGAFVASSGLESFIAHGFHDRNTGTLDFIRDSLESYASSALSFVQQVHTLVSGFLVNPDASSADAVIAELTAVDELYHTTCLNTVTRRASTAQGVALLTLYTRGLAPPGDTSLKATLIDELKLLVRKGSARGHLPVCWALLTACLGLSCDRTLYLHLFLHARGVLSAAIRLNTIGPYAAQQLLLHSVRPLLDAELERHRLRASQVPETPTDTDTGAGTAEASIVASNPACTWPLGEILAARHDLQHSRIFNS
ncbi:urease accessory protein UreF [Auricularia subglabra TFB-10046 SS5]|nr:urease accessory protein UreF [Auricularia subglabra TFB-10046 SS5]